MVVLLAAAALAGERPVDAAPPLEFRTRSYWLDETWIVTDARGMRLTAGQLATVLGDERVLAEVDEDRRSNRTAALLGYVGGGVVGVLGFAGGTVLLVSGAASDREGLMWTGIGLYAGSTLVGATLEAVGVTIAIVGEYERGYPHRYWSREEAEAAVAAWNAEHQAASLPPRFEVKVAFGPAPFGGPGPGAALSVTF
jgi:hypothetical protein